MRTMARPASLHAYGDLAGAVGSGLEAAAHDLGDRLDRARHGAVDIPLRVAALDADLRSLGARLAGLGQVTAELGTVLEELDRGSAAGLASVSDVRVVLALGSTTGLVRPLDAVTSTSTHVARWAVDAREGALLGQRVAALIEMARGWLRREVLTWQRDVRVKASAAWRFATLRWLSIGAGQEAIHARSAPAITAQARRMEKAHRVFVYGRGPIRTASRVIGPVAAMLDADVVLRGSPYDGRRGQIDRGVAAVGLVAGVVIVTSLAVAVAPAVLSAAAIGATAAAVWGLGNLAYDHRDKPRRWGKAASGTIKDSAATLASVPLRTVGAVADGVTSLLGTSGGGRRFGFAR